MTQRSKRGAGVAAVLAACLLAAAAPRAASAERGGDPRVPFERYRLDNGLEVILHQDRSLPLVAVNVWYHVGAGEETPGKSGFAHLFEHMMFQGTKHTGEDAHFEILKKIGGSGVNGTTSYDRTNYFQVVPSHQIEVGLWLESDRMGYMLPLLTEESLANQRDVVRNERRQRYDNVPYGKERFVISELMFAEGHPYRYLVIGKHEDVEGGSMEDVRSFFHKWYVPANATLTLAGDFEIDEAKRLVEKWFGSFPRSERPARRTVPPTPITETKRRVIEDPFARLRRVHYAWHTPASFAAGDAELEILADALGRNGTGRIWRVLVHEKQLAQSVTVYQWGSRFSGQFHIIVDLKPGADQAVVERIIDAELDRALREPLDAREIARAVTAVEARFVWGLESLMARAELLQRYNHFVGDPDHVTQDLDRYRKATPQGILEHAKRHLQKRNRVEVITMPAAAPGKPQAAASKGGVR